MEDADYDWEDIDEFLKKVHDANKKVNIFNYLSWYDQVIMVLYIKSKCPMPMSMPKPPRLS